MIIIIVIEYIIRGEKMTAIYGIILMVALLMLCVYFFVDRKRDIWLMLLFISVVVCDLGYFLLSVSRSLEAALWSNSLVYLSSVFLPFLILMMIMSLSRFTYPKLLPKILVAVNTVMYLIVASGGILPVYYKSVSLGNVDGSSVLIKEYGPLHPVYKLFLISYFVLMIAVIIYTAVKKTVVSTKHTIFLAFVVFVNIGLWLAENIMGTSFEFLSVSYIITEGLILLLYGILQDYGLADTRRISDASAISPKTPDKVNIPVVIRALDQEQIESIFSNWELLETLSRREKEVLCFIFENRKRKDIAEALFVTESTIKKHTASIFRKLEITSRTELFEKVTECLNGPANDQATGL